MKKYIKIMLCIFLVASLLTVVCTNVFAERATIDVGNSVYGSRGEGFLNSYTGASYADTVAISNGNESVSVELYIDYYLVQEKENVGSSYTTAWVRIADSGSSAQSAHYIVRDGVIYRGYGEVFVTE